MALPEESHVLPRLKRLLRPLDPVLRPAWRRLRPLVGRSGRPWLSVQRAGFAVADRWDLLRGRSPAPIRPLRRYEFEAIARRFAYYRARAGYMSVASDIAGGLIRRDGLRSALELGAHLRPVIVGADVMDIVARADLQAEGQVIVHDATKTPWPIADRRYDLFVGLQVFEHLGTRQNEAFLEVCRVARHAIISLPIDWQMPDPTNCHHQISPERALSWFLPVVPTRIVLGNGGKKKRLIYVFEELPDHPAVHA